MSNGRRSWSAISAGGAPAAVATTRAARGAGPTATPTGLAVRALAWGGAGLALGAGQLLLARWSARRRWERTIEELVALATSPVDALRPDREHLRDLPEDARRSLLRAFAELGREALLVGSAASGPFPTSEISLLLDRAGRVVDVAEPCAALLGWKATELEGRTLAGLVHEADAEGLAALIGSGALVRDGRPSRTRIRRGNVADGCSTVEWTEVDRWPEGALMLRGQEVTGVPRWEADLRFQASHDPLTGLANRAALMQLGGLVVSGACPSDPMAILMIDLDRFKDVNDSLGHAVGDQLLAQVGPRLRGALRPRDAIARLGGDEFAVLLPDAGEAGAALVARRLAGELDEPFVVGGMDLHVDASIGIAVSHRDGLAETTTIEGLLRQADIAMYRAKTDGCGIASFDSERDSAMGRAGLELSVELRRAIGDGQLVVHYQPVVDVVEGRLAGVEALVRWQHPLRGLLPPGVFLPLAEQTGLIVPLSRVVLESALTQAAVWARQNRPVQIAVNLSPRWLQVTDIPQLVQRLLDEQGVSPTLLRLEIIESVLLAEPEQSLTMLLKLRDMGIGLSLDDFGTGYSSMTHLRSLPVDELKVDRAFVGAMTTSPEDAVIVRAAVELGQNLGMHVVAEGIEDAHTLAEIVASGCSLAQGFYFAKPLPATELMSWADERFPGWAVGGVTASRQVPIG